MNTLRKWLAVGLVGSICVTGCLMSGTVSAAGLTEQESNDTTATANTLTVNTEMTGNLSSSDDIDYYAVTLEKDAAISIQFENPEQKYSYTYWKYSIVTQDGATLRTWEQKGNVTSYTTDTMGFSAGTYYIKVFNSSSTDNYTLLVNYTVEDSQTQLYEKECTNDTLSDADTLPLNTSLIGNLYSSDDVDYYQIELDEDGAISIQFKNPEQEYTYSYWKYSLVTQDGTTLRTWEQKGNVTSYTTDTMGFSAGTYYIKVQSYYSSSSSMDNYTLLVNYTAEDSQTQLYEKECKNDTLSDADTLPLNTSIVGNLYSSDDVDYYQIKLDEDGAISIQFENPEQTYTYSYWEYSFMNASGDILYTWEEDGDVTKKVTNNLGFSAGTYYIKVQSSVSSTMDNYTLTVQYTAASDSDQAYEKECANDTIDAAEDLTLGSSVIGSVYSTDGDRDFFKFTLNSNASITIKFEHPEQEYNYINAWEISVLNASGEVVEKYESLGKTTSLTTDALSLSAGTYYIRVCTTSYDTTDNYTLTVSTSAAAFTLGDVDADGDIDITDASLALQQYASAAAGLDDVLDSTQKLAADVDEDDTITITDASLILGYYAKTAAGLNPTGF